MLKRLIEVALPLKEVSEQSAREKSIRHGHISTLHIWWARRPLAACRAAAPEFQPHQSIITVFASCDSAMNEREQAMPPSDRGVPR